MVYYLYYQYIALWGSSLEMCTKLNAVFPSSRNNDIMSKRVTLMRVMSETRCEMTQYKMDTPFTYSYYTKSQGHSWKSPAI